MLGVSQAPDGVIGTASVSAASTAMYSTNFPLVENVLSEGGKWHHLDPTLTFVRVSSINGVNVAHGTQSAVNAYDDSNAYLDGFSENHSIQGTIWISPNATATPFREVELLLRWSDDNPPRNTDYGPTSATGYEININNTGQYLNIGSFKGPLLAANYNAIQPRTGDVFKAEISQNPDGSATIVVYWNGVEKLRHRDANPIRGGNPGIGFFVEGGAPNNQFGFTRITATSTDVGLPSAPANLRIIAP
jgi:hypothetical protein